MSACVVVATVAQGPTSDCSAVAMTSRCMSRLRARLVAAREILSISLGPERIALSAIQADAVLVLAEEGKDALHSAGLDWTVKTCDMVCAVAWESRDCQRLLQAVVHKGPSDNAPNMLGIGAPMGPRRRRHDDHRRAMYLQCFHTLCTPSGSSCWARASASA